MTEIRAKIKEFTNRGHTITGVIHVGTSWGEEIGDYLAMGIQNVIGFEPEVSAYKEAVSRWERPGVTIYNYGLGDKSEIAVFRDIDDPDKMEGHPVGTGGSSFLDEINGLPERCKVVERRVHMWRFDDFMTSWQKDIDMEKFDCLVIDVQGMELQVLKGFGEYLNYFKYFNIECSREPIYNGEAPAQEIIDFLASMGVEPITPVEDHNDILFLRQ